jgi:toxin CcdB
MPQFDVFRAQGELLLDCQSDALGYLATRIVAPLIPIDRAPERRPRLNPVIEIDGQPHVMVTQFAATVHSNELRTRITNLAVHRLEIIGAFDMLLTGI